MGPKKGKGKKGKEKPLPPLPDPPKPIRRHRPEDPPACCQPDFIYGGPFVPVPPPDPFLNTKTPMNFTLQGTFKQSYAYHSLKDRLPIILTKVIDYCSKGGKAKASGANDADLQSYIQFVAKLKNDLVTNKTYELFTIDTEEGKKWNEWIQNQDNQHYFTNTWVFTECYVYRKLREGAELRASMKNFDPFDEQKEKSIDNSMFFMCCVADKLVTMLPPSEKDKRKQDFVSLLKICLWSNKCDLSLTMGDEVTLGGKDALTPDPFQLILDWKDKILADDSGKAADQICAKADKKREAIEGNVVFKQKCSCHRLAKAFGTAQCEKEETAGSEPPSASPSPPPAEGEAPEEPPKIPCPAKITIPSSVMFDIVCDNAGYELFADLCLAHFLVSQNIVQKVRFHVKNMPWFVSDVTEKDFKHVIDACMRASFSKTIEAEPKPAPPDGAAGAGAGAGAEPEAPRTVTADNVRAVAAQWKQFVDDGVFIVTAEDYWTWPHVYKDMKKYDYHLYRKLQLSVAVLFKGDLNYRKLLGEKNWMPYTTFEASLQGFIPAPVLAVRTVKADLISGMPKPKAKGKKNTLPILDQLALNDPKWMEKGDYGVIQFCPKAEALRAADRPCAAYCSTCYGDVCGEHRDM